MSLSDQVAVHTRQIDRLRNSLKIQKELLLEIMNAKNLRLTEKGKQMLAEAEA